MSVYVGNNLVAGSAPDTYTKAEVDALIAAAVAGGARKLV